MLYQAIDDKNNRKFQSHSVVYFPFILGLECNEVVLCKKILKSILNDLEMWHFCCCSHTVIPASL